MQTIKKVFKYGPGPSSSHTIGPKNAVEDFLSEGIEFDYIDADLYGSLALTGKGHLTDKIIIKTALPIEARVHLKYGLNNLEHPNTLILKGYKDDLLISTHTYFSIGGGEIVKDGVMNDHHHDANIYPFATGEEIRGYLNVTGIDDVIEIVDRCEDKDINEFLGDIVDKMLACVDRNLKAEGLIPGELRLKRVAKNIFETAQDLPREEKVPMLLTAFAYAAAEGNASGDEVVTSPTCGSSGVIAALVYYEYNYKKVSKEKIIDGLKIAGLICNIAKELATISGAVGGCQAEIGVASAMAAGMLAHMEGFQIQTIDYAAEVAMEHFLGLTCDPVKEYVQVPCIERNGVGVLHAYSSFLYAKNISPFRKGIVSMDDAFRAMKLTGDSLNTDYKETSKGGLAKVIK